MTVAVTSMASTLEQINSLNTRAVFGGVVLVLSCLVATALFKYTARGSYYTFTVLVGTIGLVSGVLIASALYITLNPNIVVFWNFSL